MRAFIGIRIKPSAEVLRLLGELGSLGYVKTVEPENLHINLKFLGEIDGNQVKELEKRFTKLSGAGPFSVDCAGVDAYPSAKFVRVVLSKCHSERLVEFKQKLRDILDDFLPGKESGEAHLTLGRLRRKPDGRLEDFFSKHAGFRLHVPVELVELNEVKLSPKGPAYSALFSARL
ncbi:RNA 2',3'-cyclic phosphodiesterase [archaeon]|nr:RNA 2',3'-cyclic phosphodiesterase [archaeon]